MEFYGISSLPWQDCVWQPDDWWTNLMQSLVSSGTNRFDKQSLGWVQETGWVTSGEKFITSTPGSLTAQPEDNILFLQKVYIPGLTLAFGLWTSRYDCWPASYGHRLPGAPKLKTGARVSTDPQSILPSVGFGSKLGKGQGWEMGAWRRRRDLEVFSLFH